MTNGTILRIRHRDRVHTPNRAAYIYIDLSGDYPQVLAEIPVQTGVQEGMNNGR